MYPKEQTINYTDYDSAGDLLGDLINPKTPTLAKDYSGALYRGESSLNYSLLPTALRKSSVDSLLRDAGVTLQPGTQPENKINNEYEQCMYEHLALQRFFNKADSRSLTPPHIYPFKEGIVNVPSTDLWPIGTVNRVWLPVELRELAGLAQHYGIQTRLLDWSFDILVALYFAASGALRKYESGSIDKSDKMVLWVLYLFGMRMETHNGYDRFPLSIVKPPYRGNENLAAQAGAFTLWEQYYYPIPNGSVNNPPQKIMNETEINREPLDELILKFPKAFGNIRILTKCTLPITECFKLLRILYRLNYDASRIFPGYDGVTRSLHEERSVQIFST